MKNITIFSILFIWVLTSNLGFSQQVSSDTIPVDPANIPVLPGDEVEVLKDFKARLAETQMIKILAELPVQTTTTMPYNYEVNVRGLSLDYLPPVIRPVALPREEAKETYNSMLQFAYGYPRLSQARAEVFLPVNDKLNVGLRYDHLAAKNTERSPASFYRHNGKVYSNYTINDAIQAKAEFNIAMDRHYLVDRVDGTSNDMRDTRLYGFKMGFEHPLLTESSLDYTFDIGYESMLISVFEDADIDARFFTEAYAEKRIGPIGVGLGFDYHYVEFNERSVNAIFERDLELNRVGLSPKLKYNTELWNISAGLDLLWENGSGNYLPQVEVMYALAGSKLQVGAFAKTDIRLNSITNIQSYNPYFGRLDTILHEKTQKYGIALEGNFDRYEFGVELGYMRSKDLLAYNEANGVFDLYRNIRWNGSHIDANSLFAELTASYKIASNIKLNTNFIYQNYRDSLDQDIAGTFDVKWRIGADISLLEDKLTIQPAFDMLMNIERGYDYDHTSINDLSIDIDYRIHKNASVYIKSYNLLNNKNERWAGYPSLGIGVAGGVSVRF